MELYTKGAGGTALDGTPTETPHDDLNSQVMPLNISRPHNRSNKIIVWFQYKDAHDKKLLRKVIGREAQTLLWLHEAGPKGITAAEVRHWAWRLSAYVHDLRHVYELSIQTVNETHNGGWHGRYILESSIAILQYQPKL